MSTQLVVKARFLVPKVGRPPIVYPLASQCSRLILSLLKCRHPSSRHALFKAESKCQGQSGASPVNRL